MKEHDIDSYKLIHAVSKRPALYDKEHKMYYSHKKFKQRLWKETCQEVYSDWDIMSSHSRIEHGRELQKRWKNLRTCFTREVGVQMRENRDRKEGKEVKTRKRYEYFNKMLFLLSDEQKEKLQIMQNYEPTEITRDSLENVKTELSRYEEELNDDETIMVLEPEEQYTASADINDETDERLEYRIVDDDDDKHFLLSLLKTFRQFNEKQKFEAKIEILKTLRKISFPEESSD